MGQLWVLLLALFALRAFARRAAATGATVTYRHRELTAKGMPRFTSFWRVRVGDGPWVLSDSMEKPSPNPGFDYR